MFKRTATDIDTQPTTMQVALTCPLKNVRFLPDGCYCFGDMGNVVLFRINISPPLTTIARLDGAGQCLGLPGHRTSRQWTSFHGVTLKPSFVCHQFILFVPFNSRSSVMEFFRTCIFLSLYINTVSDLLLVT